MEEKKIIFNAAGLVIGLAILIAGIFYLVKEKNDKESVKIYSIISTVGGVIFVAMLLKNIFEILG